MSYEILQVNLGDVVLDFENPRHQKANDETDAILKLCADEDVRGLAKDIAQAGLNPMDVFGLIENGKKPKTYTVVEGNRRICALKLLVDPERAPEKDKPAYRKLHQNCKAPNQINAFVFKNREDARPWLDRIHANDPEGTQRRRWNAEQKTRFSGNSKNALAQAVLDYAQDKGFITDEERKGKITTAQRYLGNDEVKQAIGIDTSDKEVVQRVKEEPPFDAAVRQFVRDLVEGNVSSRGNKEEQNAYALGLRQVKGSSDDTTDAVPISLRSKKQKRTIRKPPRKAPKVKFIRYEAEIYNGLHEMGDLKLATLYYSVCKVDLENHTPLLAVGVWAFLRSLTARMGWPDSKPFPTYFDKNKLRQIYNLKNSASVKSYTDALDRLNAGGNATKHHGKGATFDGQQLANDVDVLRDCVLHCIEEIKKNG